MRFGASLAMVRNWIGLCLSLQFALPISPRTERESEHAL
jgi:hypothetical protein